MYGDVDVDATDPLSSMDGFRMFVGSKTAQLAFAKPGQQSVCGLTKTTASDASNR